MAFCTQCGKRLNDGEVCECKVLVNDENLETNNMEVSALAVTPKKSALYISEILNLFKNTIFENTVKQVYLSAKENGILWVFVMLVESIINSLAITIVFRSLARKLMSITLGGFAFGSGLSFGNSSKILSNIGLGFFSLSFRMFVLGVVVFFITSGLTFVLLKVCKKNCNFNNVGNMVSTAAIVLTFLSVIGFVLSFILPSLSILLFIVAIISIFILLYLGIQKIDKFTESPFWMYIIFLILVIGVNLLAVRLLMPNIRIDQIFSGLF